MQIGTDGRISVLVTSTNTAFAARMAAPGLTVLSTPEYVHLDPEGLAIGRNGEVYFTENAGAHRVMRFAPVPSAQGNP